MVYLRKALELVESSLELLKLKIRHPEQFTASSASPPLSEKFPKPTEKTEDSDFQLEWTDDVIKLLELALSVHRTRSINHGKISITATVNFFFRQFGLNPGNFFSTYGVMRTRAGSRTKYLDELKTGLEEKMDEDDRKEEEQKKRK